MPGWSSYRWVTNWSGSPAVRRDVRRAVPWESDVNPETRWAVPFACAFSACRFEATGALCGGTRRVDILQAELTLTRGPG